MKTMLTAVLASILLTGCAVLTVHPPFPDGDQIFDPALVGVWGPEDEDGIFYFLEGPDDSYRVLMSTEEGSARLAARMYRVEGQTFLDVWPDPPYGDVEEGYGGMLLALHFIAHIELEGDTLYVSSLDQDFVEDRLEAESSSPRFLELEDNILLTHEADEVRTLILDLIDEPDAWNDDPLPLLRFRPGGAGTP